ncbi:MAG: MFS transporter, partial [Acidobacteria bacterium]|nr:MFS transporter [Acidobacteriota bacterium]
MTPPPGRLRWSVVAMLVGFSLVSYIERMNISVAARFMEPDLGLTPVEMGRVFSAFLLGYAALQIPVGMLADRFGPARVLGSIVWLWAALTIATGWLPGLWGGPGAALVTLMAVRFLLGLSVAGVYPLCARTVANWMPTPERAFAYSFVIAGVSLGSSVTPPAMAWLMTTIGWREALYISALPAVVIGLVWIRYGADSPRTHPDISAEEREYIVAGQSADTATPATAATWLAILRTPSLLLLSLSYFFIGNVLYVFIFWFFRYLIDVREFT